MKSISTQSYSSVMASFLLVVACFLLSASPAVAVNNATWNGGSSGFFTANWTGDGSTSYTIGGATSDIAYLGNVASGTQTVTVSSTGTIGSLYFVQTTAGAADFVTINSGDTLFISKGSPDIGGTASTTETGATSATVSTGYVAAGTAGININGTLQISTANTGVVNNFSNTINMGAGGTIAIVNTGVSISATNDFWGTINASTGTSTIEGFGTGSGTAALVYNFESGANLNVTGGEVDIEKASGGGGVVLTVNNLAGSNINVASSGTLGLIDHDTKAAVFSNAGTVTQSGEIYVSSDGAQTNTITNSGTWIVSGANASLAQTQNATTGASLAFTSSGNIQGATGANALGYSAASGAKLSLTVTGGTLTPGPSIGNGTLSIGTLTFNNVNLTVNSTVGVPTLNFDITGTSSGQYDVLTLSSGALTLTSGDLDVTLDGFTPSSSFSIPILNYSSETGSLTLEVNGTTNSNYSILYGSTTADLVFAGSGSVTPSTNFYFVGSDGTNTFTDALNYYTAASGGSQQTGSLTSTSNVFINATSPTASNTPVTLNATKEINSLTLLTGGAAGSLAGTGTLGLVAGITDSATGGTTETVSPSIQLYGAQTWTVSSGSNTLAISGAISDGTGTNALALSGPGTFNFSNGSSTYAGGTSVSGSATLLITNTSGSSALGSGTLSVAPGATLGGSGNASGLASFAIGSGSGARAQVIVGSGGNNTSTNLTLAATGASTITNANLTFNLATATNTGNELNLGATPVTFSSTTLTLNLVGSNIIAADTSYVLITDSNGFSGLNVAQGTDGIISSGLSLATTAFFGAGTPYANSYLYVTDNGDQIDVMVVPEPSTWATMLAGFGVLLFWQRQRSRGGRR
jgi:hypothetical protein